MLRDHRQPDDITRVYPVDHRLVLRRRLAILAGFLRDRHQLDLALAADHLAELAAGTAVPR